MHCLPPHSRLRASAKGGAKRTGKPQPPTAQPPRQRDVPLAVVTTRRFGVADLSDHVNKAMARAPEPLVSAECYVIDSKSVIVADTTDKVHDVKALTVRQSVLHDPPP